MRFLVSLCFFVVTMVSRADDLALWKIQKLLASKKYVDLAHDFALWNSALARFSG